MKKMFPEINVFKRVFFTSDVDFRPILLPRQCLCNEFYVHDHNFHVVCIQQEFGTHTQKR